jgi:hypothetical protein
VVAGEEQRLVAQAAQFDDTARQAELGPNHFPCLRRERACYRKRIV